jgi:hypothetical protein
MWDALTEGPREGPRVAGAAVTGEAWRHRPGLAAMPRRVAVSWGWQADAIQNDTSEPHGTPPETGDEPVETEPTEIKDRQPPVRVMREGPPTE